MVPLTLLYTETMSTYLMLRSNQETGPFTLEEIREISLKSFDLIWVVGKSAAWRYPGEIPEFKSFAPPVPDQRVNSASQAEPAGQETTSKKAVPSRVYVNFPKADKRVTAAIPPIHILEPEIRHPKEPADGYAPLYSQPSKAVRYSGKAVWIGTIVSLFGAGILTGYFISDRRKFFSTAASHSISPAISPQPETVIQANETTPVVSNSKRMQPISEEVVQKTGSSSSGHGTESGDRKILKTAKQKQDSLVKKSVAAAPLPNLTDSTLQSHSVSVNEGLSKKMKAHPENYVNLVTGRYSTGLLGGISAVPIMATNNSPVKLDLLVITIDYIQSNNKVFKTENLSFYDLEPGESVTEKAPKSPRGIKISQRITVVNSHQIELHYSN